VKVIWVHCRVVGPRVMFALIVRQILLAGVPFKRIHILCFLFTSPKLPHFHYSRALSFDGIIGNPDCSCVVAVDGGFGLCVAEVFERESKNQFLLGSLKIMLLIRPRQRMPQRNAGFNIACDTLHLSVWVFRRQVTTPGKNVHRLCCGI